MGLTLGAFLGLGVGAALGGLLGDARETSIAVGAFAGVFIGTLGGSLLGVSLSWRLPVRFRRFSPTRGVVSVRFSNPDIAASVLADLREQSRR